MTRSSLGTLAVVMGNGPSAKLIDFEFLSCNGIESVGMNAAYRYWYKIDFRPTHYICMDTVVIKSHASRIADLINEGRISRFLLRNEFLESHPEFADHARIVWFDELRSREGSLFDTNLVTTGSWAIRWMAHEGKRIIALIGIDANYLEQLPEAQRLGSGNDLRLELTSTPQFNPNYFFPDYQQAGDQYNIPNDPKYQQKTGGLVHIDALRKARDDIERICSNARIYDCSPISSHQVFEKTELARVLAGCQIALATSFYCSAPVDELENNFRITVANASNLGIASVTILLEGDLAEALTRIAPSLSEEVLHYMRCNRIRIIPIAARPSYLELFDAARTQGVELCAVANSDIHLSEEFTSQFICEYIESSRPFVALTRWNKTANGNFLQGQIAHPPWQEIPVDEITYLQTNYLSFDTYLFDRCCPLPSALSQIRIGTFGCDTAIAALMRVAGQAVTNPCLTHISLHMDEKRRNYNNAIGDEQMMHNAEVIKKVLMQRYDFLPGLSSSLQALEDLPRSLASIGVPMHSRGSWNSFMRLLGLTPWTEQLNPTGFKSIRFLLGPDEIVRREQEIVFQFSRAMDASEFIEIEVSGKNNDHYLECFGSLPELRKLRERLLRYDRQAYICVDMVGDDIRSIHADLVLIAKQHLSLLSASSDKSPGAASIVNLQRESAQRPSLHKYSISSLHPRLLIIDPTRVGHCSATGQVKKTFLGDWPLDRVMQICRDDGAEDKLRLLPQLGFLNYINSQDDERLTNACKAFNPDVIYVRPVDSLRLLEFSERIVAELNKPMVVHVMDDWPERLHISDPQKYTKLNGVFLRLLGQASLRLSISQAMSDAYQLRYGGEWVPLANGVELTEFPAKDWSKRPPISQKFPFMIRYMGALADDMTYSSVRDIAAAVSALQSTMPVRFEIYTMEWYRSKAEQDIAKTAGVSVHPLIDDSLYKQSLCQADALVIAYNFDPKSISYTRLSLANKMPECLASGAPLIAYGPITITTIRYLKEAGCAQVVDERDQDRLISAIQALVKDTSLCQHLAKQARAHVADMCSKQLVQKKFKKYMLSLSKMGIETSTVVFGPFSRDQHAYYDETDCISELFKENLCGQVMIDVGAHHGWAHFPFLDHGWRIFAFEPDNQNRAKLLERLAKHKNNNLVSLDSRCVSNKSQKGISFFTSEQSTGISSLSAFHKTHLDTQKVDTITLAEFFQDKPMPVVDFLKIDTEGYDLFVLQGFPWERGKPAVIECEFEDTKTVPLGYNFHHLSRFLVDKGYTVYVSEWHPIIRYGIRHDWRQLTRYPCELADPKGWGNLLAFRDPVEEKALMRAAKKALKVGVTKTTQYSASQHKQIAPIQPELDLQLFDANYGFRFDPGTHFTSIAPNQWRFTDAVATQKLWIAAMDSPGPTAGRSFVGTLRVMADRAMTINVSLGRHGQSEYEGTTKRVVLTPGVPQTVMLKRQFKLVHQALKLQVEVLNLPDGDLAVLTVDELGLSETLASIRERLGSSNLDLRTANRLFREGDYTTALGIYLWLSQCRPLPMYVDNVVRAAKRMGMTWANKTSKLAWITSADQ